MRIQLQLAESGLIHSCGDWPLFILPCAGMGSDIAFNKGLGDICVYSWVVVTEAWPRSSCTVRTSAPPWIRCVAHECLSVCGWTSLVIWARCAADWTISHTDCRDRRAPRLLRNIARISCFFFAFACSCALGPSRYRCKALQANDPTGTIRCLELSPSTLHTVIQGQGQ